MGEITVVCPIDGKIWSGILMLLEGRGTWLGEEGEGTSTGGSADGGFDPQGCLHPQGLPAVILALVLPCLGS